MFGLETLDVLIGLATVYLVFGIACTAIVEAFAAWFSVRSNNLEAALKEFLAGDLKTGQLFVKAFYDHPLVQALSKGKDGRPSYIPPEIVGQVVEALITANGTVKFADAVQSLPDGSATEPNRVKGLLGAFVTQTKEDAAAFRKAVETHFNAVMDRASGWVKRRQQTVAFVVSVVLVMGANVDTVTIATSLASSPEARARMVEIAEQQLMKARDFEKTIGEQRKTGEAKGEIKEEQAKQQSEGQEKTSKVEGEITVEQARQRTKDATKTVEQTRSYLLSAGLRFGWKDQWKDVDSFSGLLAKVAGLLVSIFAVSLGAPFWFDALQGFMQVRTTGPREATDQKKK
jgi:hypothetical protein